MGTPGATVMETYLRLKLRRTDVDPGGVNYTAYPVEFLYPWYGPYYLGVYMSGVDDGTKKRWMYSAPERTGMSVAGSTRKPSLWATAQVLGLLATLSTK